MDDAKRARLMKAAMDEFAERGVKLASYNKIIERSGLSKGTVYYYFDNKESLLLAFLNELCELFRSAMGDIALPNTKEEYWEAEREYHRRAIKFFIENPQVCRVIFWLSKDAPYTEEQLEDIHAKTSRFIDELLSRGQELGTVRSDIPLETIQRLMHAIGRYLSADIMKFGKSKNREEPASGDKDSAGPGIAEIEKLVLIMHDISKRILTPEEDLACFKRF